MIQLNIHEAKTHLSRYLKRLEAGERIVLCRRNQPVAELRAIAKPATKPRPIGLGKGELEVPASFFEPLPASELEGFEGRAV